MHVSVTPVTFLGTNNSVTVFVSALVSAYLELINPAIFAPVLVLKLFFMDE